MKRVLVRTRRIFTVLREAKHVQCKESEYMRRKDAL